MNTTTTDHRSAAAELPDGPACQADPQLWDSTDAHDHRTAAQGCATSCPPATWLLCVTVGQQQRGTGTFGTALLREGRVIA